MSNVCSPTITEENDKVNQKTPVSMAAGQSHSHWLCCFSSSLLLLYGSLGGSKSQVEKDP